MAPERAQRWSSRQPNVPGLGIVAGYTGRFWVLVVIIGVLTGAAASALMGLLELAQHLAFGYDHGSFLGGVRSASAARRVISLLIAAGLVAGGGLVLRHLATAGATEVTESLWLRGGRLRVRPSLARGALSVITVGMGVSLGREAAPQLAGASVASRVAEWAQLPVWQRRLLVASGAGAGFAAVYNVPLGGALFALEVLLGTLALPLVLPALAVSVTATAVAWITLGTEHTYSMPAYALHPAQVVWALICGPIIGVVAVGWVRLIAKVVTFQHTDWRRLAAPMAVFGALGLLAIPYPQLLGNGQAIVQLALLGGFSLGLASVLLVLKPLVTAACLGAGAPGGLVTPTLTLGVLLATVLAGIWSHIWTGAIPASYALIGGGAFLAAAMQGPLSGIVIVLELTRHFDALMVPTLLAVTEATVVARRLGAPSIYSARLPAAATDSGYQAVVAIETLDAVGDPGQPAGRTSSQGPARSSGESDFSDR